MVNPKRFYTYAYLREDRTPYYIGKGNGNRAYRKKRGQIHLPKDKSRIIFLKQNLTEEEAFKHEKYMIAVFGRKDLGTGILHNRTNGGEGTSGFEPWNKGKTGVYNEETLLKMKSTLSIMLSGSNNPMYGKKGKDHPAYGYRHTPESRKIISEGQLGEKNHMYGRFGEKNHMYGRKHTPESRRIMSERQLGEKNHNYGKICITNGLENKYINLKDVIPDGWIKGRTLNRIWITNGIENKYFSIHDMIPYGWHRGRTNKRKTKM